MAVPTTHIIQVNNRFTQTSLHPRAFLMSTDEELLCFSEHDSRELFRMDKEEVHEMLVDIQNGHNYRVDREVGVSCEAIFTPYAGYEMIELRVYLRRDANGDMDRCRGERIIADLRQFALAVELGMNPICGMVLFS